jgi:tetratricopeptide (TPR) repeat protein
MAGDIDKAAQLAPDGPDASEPGRRLGRLAKVVAALGEGKGRIAKETLGNDGIGFPHRSAAALLAPWAAAAAGDTDGSLIRPQLRGDAGVEYFGQIGQAHLYERAKRFDEAETDFKAVTASETPSEIAVSAYGGFLERRGRKLEAIALYDAALKRNPANLSIKAAKARAEAGKSPPPAPTIKEGAAFALLAPAATMIAAKQEAIGLAYLRMALKLDPQRNDAWLMVGDILQQQGDVDGARAAYEKPKPNSPEFPAAQAKLAWSYQAAGDKEGALRLARAAAATGDREGRLTLSDLLRTDEKFDEAITLLNGIIAEDKAPDWQLYFARGQAYERSGRWKEAEADLKKALALRPDEAELLNYLGYAWIDRGEHLQEAMGMVEKAVAANPRSGAIVDSLGWAHYRTGDYKKAAEILEQAVELEAGDPEINNHLGDAYWMVGRKDEAVFQWKRVLTLKPDDKVKADAEKKLASGVGPTPKVAGQ